MVERNASSIVSIARRFLLCFFVVTCILFVLSWFYVLRSTGNSLLPMYNFLPVKENAESTLVSRFSSDPSITNKAILADKPEEEEEEVLIPEKKDECRCNANQKVPLKVYMYDMDPEFHFGLLDWKPEGKSVWPDIQTNIPLYPGGLNLQHSIEYWLTLDLLVSEYPNPPQPRAAIRVRNSSEADVILVPFFSSLSFNRFSKINPHQKASRDRELQDKMVKFLTGQKEWERSGGRDHVILAHHPNSLSNARMQLFPAMFILADFGRYPPSVANVEKDVIAPYRHVIKSYANDTSDFDSRTTLLYFQGAIYRKDGGFVRQELYYLLRDEKDVHFSFGSVKNDGVNKASQGMHSSKFCLNIAGDTPSSNRLFDAIASHCVPVIISDEIELPYEDVLDYSEFCIFIRTSDAIKENFVINLIRNIKKDEWTRMWQRLKEIEKFYEFHFPSKEDDAVQMIWQAVARKVPAFKLKVHRSRRYARTILAPEAVVRSMPVPKSFW